MMNPSNSLASYDDVVLQLKRAVSALIATRRELKQVKMCLALRMNIFCWAMS